MKRAEELNKYDYESMIKNYEISSRHNEHLNQIKKKWEAFGKRYKENLEHIKEMNEENYQKKNKALIAKMKKREKLILDSLENNRKNKMLQKQRAISQLMEKENSAREKIKQHFITQENDRLRFEKLTAEKIEAFKKRSMKQKENLHNEFVAKINEKEQRHENNMIRVKQENEEQIKKTEDKEFSKYVSFYFQRKKKQESIDKKNIEKKNKQTEKLEKFEEIEKENNERQKKIINKMKTMEKNKLKYEQERNEFLLQEKKLREERMEKTAKNREAIETEDNEWRKNVIDYQTEMFNRTLNKDNKEENGNKRKNETKVNKEMELESNLSAFNRKMNELKQDAVLTKNEEERMQMYKKVKKEEYEMKKKEEEDLMLERSGKI